MSFNEWEELCLDIVEAAERIGYDRFGKPIFGSPVPYKSRVVYKEKLIRLADGRSVSAMGHIWMPYITDITSEWQITLPDGEEPPILLVERYPDDEGPNHTKIFFQ